jgi:hypothetical protein
MAYRKPIRPYRTAERWAAGILVTWLLFILLAVVLSFAGCSRYNPALYPSYDVLNLGPEVRKNPLGFTEDGNLIVTPAFIQWVDELKQEIIKLRKGK